MNAVVFEHVPVAELPEEWRAQLSQADHLRVTVRIEPEPQAPAVEAFETDDPAFGTWRDRTDMDDVPSYVRQLRQPRRGGAQRPGGDREGDTALQLTNGAGADKRIEQEETEETE